jgi:hypothetical protein
VPVGAVVPEALYDTLVLVEGRGLSLEPSGRLVTTAEIHLFAFMACLLALYDSKPVADWGYVFVRPLSGGPFAAEIDAAVEHGLSAGLIHGGREEVSLGETGAQLLSGMRNLLRFRDRGQYLNAAWKAGLTNPPAMIRAAFKDGLGIPDAVARARHVLPTTPTLAVLYEHFGALRSAIPANVESKLIPALLWLSYLQRVAGLRTQNLEPRLSA